MRLFEGLEDPFQVWMSHGDKLSALPEGFFDIGATSNAEHAAIASEDRVMYGIQFHPEVTHTPQGRVILRNFVLGICGAKADWEMGSFVNEAIARIREEVGEEGHVIGAVSGGVDSSVAAVLLNRAIGKRFHAVLVDNGVLRLDEAKEVMARLGAAGIDLHLADASELFLSKLAGVSDPEKKRKIIGTTFIDVFEEEARKLDGIDFLAQGTIYPDIVESGTKTNKIVKSHHNVGGLPDDLKFELVEPLKYLFKDEVRACGKALGLPDDMVYRQPFPGPGLGVRCLGAITRDRLEAVRESDAILREEFAKAGLQGKVWQYFTLIPDVKSVGVRDNARSFEWPVIIRAVNTVDAMTATIEHVDWNVLDKIVKRIITEVKGVNRVCFDMTPKPTGTIEWE